MNPLTNVRNIKQLSEQELKFGGKSSWHNQYKDSAWIFVGGLPYDLTEGDVLCIFSQYGEIVNINLVRDKETGKQRGYCFLCYEDQRSTILAVDNLNSIKLLGRTLRVDHVQNYKTPVEGKKRPFDEETRLLIEEGCAPTSKIIINTIKDTTLKTEHTTKNELCLPSRLPIDKIESSENNEIITISKKLKKKEKKKEKKKKKELKKNKKSKKKKKHSHSSDDSDSSSSDSSSDHISKKTKKQ